MDHKHKKEEEEEAQRQHEHGKHAAAHPAEPHVNPLKEECHLTGEETRALYGVLRSLHDHVSNNPNAVKGDYGPLARELKRIGWYDCTAWNDKGHCTNITCIVGLHA